MDRREFAVGLPGLLALAGMAEGQTASAAVSMKTLSSGTWKPGAGKSSQAKRASHPYLSGMLKAGNIRLEMHQTVQEPGAEHEALGTHLHNEIWCVQRGTATLFINGTEHTMEAGDVGLVCAGDEHWIKNGGPGELAYFVIAVGPPE